MKIDFWDTIDTGKSQIVFNTILGRVSIDSVHACLLFKMHGKSFEELWAESVKRLGPVTDKFIEKALDPIRVELKRVWDNLNAEEHIRIETKSIWDRLDADVMSLDVLLSHFHEDEKTLLLTFISNDLKEL